MIHKIDTTAFDAQIVRAIAEAQKKREEILNRENIWLEGFLSGLDKAGEIFAEISKESEGE